MPTWWARHAWLGGARPASGVLLEVKDGRFAAVTPGVSDPPPAAVRLEGLTLPGLANVHSHAFHRALRSRAQGGRGTFWTWRQQMYEVADRLDPDNYLRLATATYAEMALAGFTAVGEFHYVHHAPGGLPYENPNVMGHALVEAARRAGIRLTLLDTCYLESGFDVPLEGPPRRFGDGSAAGWIERVRHLQPDSRTRIGAAVHSVRAVPPLATAQVAEWAASQEWCLHAHVSEQRREQTDCLRHRGTTPLGVLAAAGAVSPSFTAVHGTHFSDADVTGLADAGGGCCLCPTTERDLGDGIGPAPVLYSAGIPVCLGSDSHAIIDGFEEARAIELDARLASGQRGLFPPEALLEVATVNGMTALGWPAGVLAPGRLADFVTVRLDSPRTAGAGPALLAAAVFAAAPGDVDVVVVDGQQVVSEGRHLLVADVGQELAAAIAEVAG
jgi:formiminoglutamate deiminase